MKIPALKPAILAASLLTACEAAPAPSPEVQNTRTETAATVAGTTNQSTLDSISANMNSNNILAVIAGIQGLIICLGLLKHKKNKKIIETLQVEKENTEKLLEDARKKLAEAEQPNSLPESGPFRTSARQEITAEPPLTLELPASAEPDPPKEEPKKSTLVEDIRSFKLNRGKLSDTELCNEFGKRVAADLALTTDDIKRVQGIVQYTYPVFSIHLVRNPNIGKKSLQDILQRIFWNLGDGEVLDTVWTELLNSCLKHPNWGNTQFDFHESTNRTHNGYYELIKTNPDYMKFLTEGQLRHMIELSHKKQNQALLQKLVEYTLREWIQNNPDGWFVFKQIPEVIASCPPELQQEYVAHPKLTDEYFREAEKNGLVIEGALKIAAIKNPRANNDLIKHFFDANDPEICDAIAENPVTTSYWLQKAIPGCTKTGLETAKEHPHLTPEIKQNVENALAEAA